MPGRDRGVGVVVGYDAPAEGVCGVGRHGDEGQGVVVMDGVEDGYEGVGSAFLVGTGVWVSGTACVVAAGVGQGVQDGVDEHHVVGGEGGFESAHALR
ncbi:hypothetical protein Kisp02_47470 [Kineosporia sp. NBRC 101731]|nr:hypothetical protein Kisp02_47470 [Kineosporia sp. NBRC 101731]